MSFRRGSRLFGVVATCAALFGLANPAAAAASGTANAGSGTVTNDGITTTLAPLAPCDVNGTATNSTKGASLPGAASYGSAQTSCAYDAASKTSTMSVTGTTFRLTALSQYGGPTIGFSGYTAGCQGFSDHGGGKFNLSGYYGVTLPNPLPANYSITIPGATPDDPPLAKLVFGEFTQPNPPDGSLRLNLLHVTLFPNGGPESGDIYVGSAYCTLTS